MPRIPLGGLPAFGPIKILDVSDYQPQVDWAQVKASGIHAVWIKATEGVTWNAKMYSKHRAGALAAGLRVGAYHYAKPDENPYDAEAEARHFAKVIGVPERRDLRPVLDFEEWGPHLSVAQHESWARAFNQEFRRQVGIYPMFYSYQSFIEKLAPKAPIGNGLWFSLFGANNGKPFPATAPPPWKKFQAHQYTSKALVPGIPKVVDLSTAKSLRGVLAYPIKGWV